MSLKNDRFLRALKRQPVDCVPIWLMRQAGRYLPEYLEVRQQAGDFMTLCQTPDLAAEVTVQPIDRFDLDAAIIFSDILTIPDAMGLGLYFETGHGPKFKKVISGAKDVEKLSPVNAEKSLNYLSQAIRLTKNKLNDKVPLIGFCGSPWTLATYMVEGGSSKQFAKIKAWLYSEPKSLLLLLDILADSVAQSLILQAKAGCNALMLFDSWGGVLAPIPYRKFSLDYSKKIIEKVKLALGDKAVPIILFSKGAGQHLPEMAAIGAHALGVDWTLSLKTAKALANYQVAIQGNLDPTVLLGSTEIIREEVAKSLAAYGSDRGHIFNLGHGILPMTNPEHVKFLVDTVHEMSAHYHQ